MTNIEYFEKVELYISRLKRFREEAKVLAARIIGENLTTDDLFFISALNRRVQFIDGIVELLKMRNLTCGGVLVRTQLDNLMRVFAAFIAKDRTSFINNYLCGEQIGNMKDNQNQKMTDGYLKKRISEYYPSIETVYNKSSGYIHLSEVAFHESFWSKDNGVVEFSVGFPPREELNPILIECAEIFCYFTEIEYNFFQKVIESKMEFDCNINN